MRQLIQALKIFAQLGRKLDFCDQLVMDSKTLDRLPVFAETDIRFRNGNKLHTTGWTLPKWAEISQKQAPITGIHLPLDCTSPLLQ